jgi:hypothetical protein
MSLRLNTYVFGLVALILSFTGFVCIMFARPYRDFILRFQGIQRLQPDWLTKFQQSEVAIWAIRTSGIVAILMAALLGYIGYMSPR